MSSNHRERCGRPSGSAEVRTRVTLAAAATQAARRGLVAMDELRKRRRTEEGFPWVDQPEIELEAGTNV